ncbi:hypothetical protein NPIL_108681 [Nephila pilipes]|uniref:Uncharacterized protein n=1 Tax=Nephila pilipes TaxID=299642 RepID=A0A8X6N5G4_NEPPI|nr:hypothetical protein NPIL_108681 [Nephila pilipes]
MSDTREISHIYAEKLASDVNSACMSPMEKSVSEEGHEIEKLPVSFQSSADASRIYGNPKSSTISLTSMPRNLRKEWKRTASFTALAEAYTNSLKFSYDQFNQDFFCVMSKKMLPELLDEIEQNLRFLFGTYSRVIVGHLEMEKFISKFLDDIQNSELSLLKKNENFQDNINRLNVCLRSFRSVKEDSHKKKIIIVKYYNCIQVLKSRTSKG